MPLRAFLAVILALLVTPTAASQPDDSVVYSATVTAETWLHTGPGQHFDIARTVPAGETFDVIARDESGLWLLAQKGAITGGWIGGGFAVIDGDADLYALPVSDESVDGAAPSPYVTMWDAETVTDELRPFVERLMRVPLFVNFTDERVGAIITSGREQGRRPDVFTRVGDSDTTSGDYLRPIGMRGDFCRWGPYAYLGETVDFYSESPRPGVRNSFDTTSAAAANGFTMAAALDPLWTRDAACLPNESPLDCEFRLVNPAVALVMLGRMDVTYFDAGFYEEAARQVIEAHLDAGVLPVLATFIVLPNNEDFADSIYFNNVLVDLASAYGVPLVNLWRGVQTLPDHGIGPDLTHLSHAVGEFCAFDGPQFTYGGTQRNLLSLLALDTVRRAWLVE